MVKVRKTDFLGKEAYEITNDVVSLVVATGIGPRIVSFGFCKKGNLLRVAGDDFFSDDNSYKFYGGHRLWHAPEDTVRSYQPDNEPCEVEVLELGVKVSVVEKENKIRRVMQIEMKENGRVRIIHTIENLSNFCVHLAPWAITQMKTGGLGVIPQVTKKTGLLPNRSISLWDYTDLSDSRLKFGGDFIYVKQDENIKKAMKIGTFNPEGYVYYFVDGDLFVKEFDVAQGEFPDFGCNCELYVNEDFLELESLGEMQELCPGESCEHTEVWSIIEKVACPTDEKLAQMDVREPIHA